MPPRRRWKPLPGRRRPTISSWRSRTGTIRCWGAAGVNLSGGQKQRLCIARALLRRPKILLLDDSTSAVDTETELKIRRGLREYLGEGTTVFVSTQRVKTMEEADRVLVLDDGKVESYGTPARLKEDSAVYREIFNSQQLTF